MMLEEGAVAGAEDVGVVAGAVAGSADMVTPVCVGSGQ